ncbi:hypothetical protein D9M70_413210 [compost metagenome]
MAGRRARPGRFPPGRRAAPGAARGHRTPGRGSAMPRPAPRPPWAPSPPRGSCRRNCRTSSVAGSCRRTRRPCSARPAPRDGRSAPKRRAHTAWPAARQECRRGSAARTRRSPAGAVPAGLHGPGGRRWCLFRWTCLSWSPLGYRFPVRHTFYAGCLWGRIYSPRAAQLPQGVPNGRTASCFANEFAPTEERRALPQRPTGSPSPCPWAGSVPRC